jgi:hypothetical protein
MHPNTFTLLAGHGAWEEEAAVDGHPLTKGYGHQIMSADEPALRELSPWITIAKREPAAAKLCRL